MGPLLLSRSPRTPADVVNLGYVINVIEELAERRQALINAWELTRKVMLVAAQVLIDDINRSQVAYGDGIVTSRNTFQKYYEQEELKIYIDQVLDVDAIPLPSVSTSSFGMKRKLKYFAPLAFALALLLLKSALVSSALKTIRNCLPLWLS
jgi:hypothetical protein